MAGQLTGNAGKQSGGIPITVWVDRYLKPASFGGIVTFPNGLPQNKAALVMTDIKVVPGPTTYVHANPGVVMDLAQAVTDYTGTVGKAAIPLGCYPKRGDNNAFTVLQQCARDYLTGGRNEGAMRPENIIAMYYNAIQNITFSLGQDGGSDEHLMAFFCLLRDLSEYNINTPECRRVTEGLCDMPKAQDTIHKMIAHVVSDRPLDRKAVLNMAGTMVSRKRDAKLIALAPGAMVIFLLLPVAKLYLSNPKMTMQKAVEVYRGRQTALAKAVEKALGGGSGNEEAVTLTCLLQTTVEDFTQEHATRVLRGDTDFAAMGLLETVKGGFQCDPKAGSSVAFENPTTALVETKNPSSWAVVALGDRGKYTFHLKPVGLVSAAKGDTRGKELTMNWRVTFGKEALPKDAEGYALSGMRKELDGGYIKSTPLDEKLPIQLFVSENEVTLSQAGRHFWTARIPANKDVAIAFKFCHMTVEWAPATPIKQEAGPAARVADDPITALRAKLMQGGGLAQRA